MFGSRLPLQRDLADQRGPSDIDRPVEADRRAAGVGDRLEPQPPPLSKPMFGIFSPSFSLAFSGQRRSSPEVGERRIPGRPPPPAPPRDEDHRRLGAGPDLRVGDERVTGGDAEDGA